MDEIVRSIQLLVDNSLIPKLSTILAQLLATFILYLAFKKWLWEPMNSYLAKRQEVIIGELESAKVARKEAHTLKEEYEKDLKSAKEEASRIVEIARSQALSTKEQIVSEAEKEAAYKLEKAEKEIHLERARVESELKSHVIDIAFTAAEKLVNENIDDKKNRQMIDKFIEEVGE